MIYQCVHCSHMVVFEINDFLYDIRCESCKRQSCGKCLKSCHYPALCHEFERWAYQHQHFQENAFINERLAGYALHWDLQDLTLDLLNAFQTEFEEFSQESYQRFHERLILPFNQMREIVGFERWFRLHVVFNPVVEAALINEYSLLVTLMNAFLDSIPPPGLAHNEWIASRLQIRLTSIDVGAAVADMIFGIPKARHIAEVEDANKAVAHWSSRMVSSSLFKG